MGKHKHSDDDEILDENDEIEDQDENYEEEQGEEDYIDEESDDNSKKKKKKEKKKKEKKERKKKKEKKEKKEKKSKSKSKSSDEQEDENQNITNDNNDNENQDIINERRKINLIKNDSGKRFDEWLIEESKRPISNSNNNNNNNNNISSSPSQFLNDCLLSATQIEKRNNSVSAANFGDSETMYRMLQSVGEDYIEIGSYIEKRLNEKKSAFDYIRAVMKSTTAETETNYQKRLRGEILLEFIKQIINYQSNIEEKQLNQIVDALLSECDGIARQSYRDVVEFISNTLNTNRRPPTLLLLPKSLEQLSFLSNNSTIDADETFKSLIIKNIVDSKWNKELFIPIISMLNDIQLNKIDLELILNKIFSEAYNLNNDEYISLSHQLILLSSKGLKGRIISGICELFSNIEIREKNNNYNGSNNLNELFCVESIIFQQLNISIKQDMDLVKEFLKLKQSPTQFNVALLMNISKIPRFKVMAFDILKKLAISFVKSSTSSENIFEATIESTTKGLDIIVEACVSFAITLMDYQLIVVNDSVKLLRSLGSNLLFMLYAGHQTIRDTILDEILSRIIMKPDIPQNWFTLLSSICHKFTADIKYSKLKESFEYLQHFSTNTVQQLITSFDRIFFIQENFLNGIIVVLKKSMFAREIEARSAGVTGFIQLIKSLSSQDAMNINSKLMNQIILEIFGILRRALIQQESIRSLLYSGLADLISTRPDLADHIFEILNNQLSTYVDLSGNRNSPFELSKYIELKTLNIPVTIEPIHKLIYCIQFCINKTNKNLNPNNNSSLSQLSSQYDQQYRQQEKRKDSQQRNDIRIKFEKLLAMTRECSIDQFGISNLTGTEIVKTQCKMLIGIIESLIEYISMADNDDITKFDAILSLYSTYNKLLKKLKENQDELNSKSSIQKNKLKSKANQDDEIDEDENDIKKSKSNNSSTKSNSTTSTTITTSKTNNSNIISSFNEFPSLECLNNLIRIIYTLPKESFDRRKSDHMDLLYYSISTLLNSSTKLYNGIKVLKKTMDFEKQIKYLFPGLIPIKLFQNVLPYLINEIMDNEWVIQQQQQQNQQQQRKPIHSITLSCIDTIITFAFENYTEVVMYNIFHPILDNIRNKEYNQQLKEYNEKKDQQQDEDEEQQKLLIPVKPQPIRGHKAIVLMIEKFQQIISSYMFPEYYQDCELLFNVLTNLYKYLTQIEEVKPSFIFLKNISSKNKIELPSLASVILKSIIDICNKQDSSITETLSKYVLGLLGTFQTDNNNNNNDIPKTLAIINDKTVSTTINILLSNEESTIDRSKEYIIQLKKDWNGGKLSDAENTILIRERDSICTNLKNCCLVLQHLSICKINGSSREKFLKLIKKLYTILTSYINMLMLFSTPVHINIKELVDLSSLLSSNIYDFSEWRDDSTKKNKNKLNSIEKARINREAKLMPTITFQLEKYESTVLKYQKKVKDNNRFNNFKKVKSREFVIERTLIDNNEGNSDDQNNSDNEKQSKKRKSSKISKLNKKKATKSTGDDDYDDQDNKRIKKKQQYYKKKII